MLFRRTMLLAEVILLAFMGNLTLINLCYGMNAGALVQSVITTCGLLFLLFQERKQLVLILGKARTSLPAFSLPGSSWKNVLRLSAILLSFLFTMWLKIAATR